MVKMCYKIYCKNKNGDYMENIEIGDVIQVKKQHPCGSSEWEILRVGADVRLKCVGCGHILLLPRSKVISMIKKLQKLKKANQ